MHIPPFERATCPANITRTHASLTFVSCGLSAGERDSTRAQRPADSLLLCCGTLLMSRDLDTTEHERSSHRVQAHSESHRKNCHPILRFSVSPRPLYLSPRQPCLPQPHLPAVITDAIIVELSVYLNNTKNSHNREGGGIVSYSSPTDENRRGFRPEAHGSCTATHPSPANISTEGHIAKPPLYGEHQTYTARPPPGSRAPCNPRPSGRGRDADAAAACLRAQ